MDGEPAGAGLVVEQAVRGAGGQEDPIAGTELERRAGDLELGTASEHDDPLVMVLDELDGAVGTPAQDLLDDMPVRFGQPVHSFAPKGRCRRIAEPTSTDRLERPMVHRVESVGR